MAVEEKYATVQQLRDEGLPGDATTVVKDAQALILLERANQLVEQITGNIFYKSAGTFVFDGNNSYLLQLPLAIVTITSLKINNDTVALDSGEYRVYNGRAKPTDDRYNPKIELRRNVQPSIFTGGASQRFFKKGFDQTVVGEFGFLEPDDSVPAVINECIIAIVMMTFQTLFERFAYTDGGPGPLPGPLKKEKTDAHEKEWWGTVQGLVDSDMIVPQYVHSRLKLYKRPIGIRATNARWIEAG